MTSSTDSTVESSFSPIAEHTGGLKVSLKNTFINVVDDCSGSDLTMPDLLRAQTTPAVYNALQALYETAAKEASTYWNSGMDPLVENSVSAAFSSLEESDAPPPEFDAEEVLRQISELTETLSALNYGEDTNTNASSSILGGEFVSAPTLNTTVTNNEVYQTTVMLRNIPNKYTSEKLIEQFIFEGFTTEDIDFFYLPIDFRNKCNVGYAFVNFRLCSKALEFMNKFENYRLPATNSSKVCTVCWARIQGKEENINQYRDSPILPEYRPWVFTSNGSREAFPEPTDPSILQSISKSSVEAVRASNATKGPDDLKIFVGGLDRSICGDDLVDYFSKFGLVKDAAVVIDRTSGKSRGFGFCLFEKYIPRDVLKESTMHVIKGFSVAVKLYGKGPSAESVMSTGVTTPVNNSAWSTSFRMNSYANSRRGGQQTALF